MEALNKLQEGWLNDGDKVPPAEFGIYQIIIYEFY